MYAPDNTTPPARGYQVLTYPRRQGKTVRSEGTRMACPHCDFDSVTRIVRRRELVDTLCPNLLALPNGLPVTYRMISRRWEDARDAAAYRAEITGDEELGKRIRAMYLRDMRSFAANLAEDIDEASKLLDHSSVNVTRKHYRTRATRLKAVR